MGEGADEEEDLFNNLPDVFLTYIVSFLPATDAARTSVLSHRWKTMWKYSSRLSFDQREMLKSLIKVYIEKYDQNKRIELAMLRREIPLKYANAFLDPIARAALLMKSTIDNHIGPLKNCSIRHMLESCASGDVVRWMKKLLEKGVVNVSLELESHDLQNISCHLTIFGEILCMPFDVLTSFKVLELKNYYLKTTLSPNSHQVLNTLTLNNIRVESNDFENILSQCSSLENLTLKKCNLFGDGVKIDSPSLKYFKFFDMTVHKMLISATKIEVIEIGTIICYNEDLIFETPNLHVIRICNDVKNLGRHLATRDIVEICSGISVSFSSHVYNILG
ncbi:putative F-box domain, leucine-rich repeat domain, L domain-containing protein [Medicago truncatula]|uniref:Putative F-box domain, leucine-rich repeat domain, L domain-containing protein n=1 Tax=Medicago truncatula TaxID=3880 RepID=A0A396J9D8_MEDTR|nr:putative F-box domain, leucine-rich repeat domain, L domain-containing protein [Medicago truncatula]